jgi:hypothetical protein
MLFEGGEDNEEFHPSPLFEKKKRLDQTKLFRIQNKSNYNSM